MGYIRYAVVSALIAFSVKLFFFPSRSSLQYKLDGYVHPSFSRVYDVFKENFDNGLETDGAAFAVYKDGQLVVSLWGGYANVSSKRPWQKDTMSVFFSSTKAVASLCIALLVDRKRLSYDDPVTKFWPEFGRNGKSNVTVRMLVDHEAGLAGLDEEITIEKAKDSRALSQMLENQKPNWPPGRERGYHPLTFGWLCDQVVQRVDQKHRSLGRFFAEEVAKPHGIEFFIGLPSELEPRVADISPAKFYELWNKLFSFMFMRFYFILFNPFCTSFLKRALTNPNWIMSPTAVGVLMVNTADFHAMELPAANGIGTAESLAKLFSLVLSGQLLHKRAVLRLAQPVKTNTYDNIMGTNISYGWGFVYNKNPMGQYVLGHPGYGGQNIKADYHNKLSFAYVTNKVKPDIGDRTVTFRRLMTAVYESVKATQGVQASPVKDKAE